METESKSNYCGYDLVAGAKRQYVLAYARRMTALKNAFEASEGSHVESLLDQAEREQDTMERIDQLLVEMGVPRDVK